MEWQEIAPYMWTDAAGNYVVPARATQHCGKWYWIPSDLSGRLGPFDTLEEAQAAGRPEAPRRG